MFLLEVAKVLAKHNITYAIVGGYAVALHGVVRGTVDIDLAIAMDAKSFEKIEAALKEIGLESRLPLKASEVFEFRNEYATRKNLMAWSFVDPSNPLHQIDVMTLIDAKKINKIHKKIQGTSVPVASLKDLIEIKEAAGRPQDIEDVRALKSLIGVRDEN